MNNLASYSPLFHTAICYWGFKMVLFIIIEWAFLNLATVFTSLLYLLPPQCLCSPEFCLQTRVRSTSRASTSGKSCRPTQWVLEIKTGPFLSEAAWNFSWIYTHQHFGISQAAFFCATSRGFFMKTCLCQWMRDPVCGADCCASSQLLGCLIWYSKYPLIILELEGETDREGKKRGEGSFTF